MAEWRKQAEATNAYLSSAAKEVSHFDAAVNEVCSGKETATIARGMFKGCTVSRTGNVWTVRRSDGSSVATGAFKVVSEGLARIAAKAIHAERLAKLGIKMK